MDTNITKDLDREQIATLIKNHRDPRAAQTMSISPAMFAAAADVGVVLTNVYSAGTADWFKVVVELGADEPGVVVGGDETDEVLTAVVRLGALPKTILDLAVSEATVVILDRVCETLTDHWNAEFEAEGLNDRADRGHLFWSALDCDDAGIEFARILFVYGGTSPEMGRHFGIEW